LLHRGLVFGTIFGFGMASVIVVAVVLFDLALTERGWCGHVCPVGAFYGAIGRFRMLRVAAPGRARCDQCRDCYLACPEPHVIAPALNAHSGADGVIRGIDCTSCGRCIDVCPRNVFAFSIGGRP
jgi:ferredoxin-type protein NapH